MSAISSGETWTSKFGGRGVCEIDFPVGDRENGLQRRQNRALRRNDRYEIGAAMFGVHDQADRSALREQGLDFGSAQSRVERDENDSSLRRRQLEQYPWRTVRTPDRDPVALNELRQQESRKPSAIPQQLGIGPLQVALLDRHHIAGQMCCVGQQIAYRPLADSQMRIGGDVGMCHSSANSPAPHYRIARFGTMQ